MIRPNIGQNYYRKVGHTATVRRILAIQNRKVTYQVLFGPALDDGHEFGTCSVANFKRWATGAIGDYPDYSFLVGARIFDTYIVQNTSGEPYFRCSDKRARFYLRKGYAVEVADKVIRLTNDQTEKKLAVLYGGTLSPFFLEVKNDRCVVCGVLADSGGCVLGDGRAPSVGKYGSLTRHHVVPRKHVKRISLPWRSSMSNVLFLCVDCHRKYNDHPEPELDPADPLKFIYGWKEHFLAVMQPKHLPNGWDIITQLVPRAG